jgi:phospholipase C
VLARRLTTWQLCIRVALLCTALLCHPLLSAQATKPSLTVTVMTYNIQQLGYPSWLASHFEKERLTLIPQTLLALAEHPDVVVFQEVFTEHAFGFLVQELSAQYPYHTGVVAEDCRAASWSSVGGDCRQRSYKGNGGVTIFSRWPIAAQHAYVYHAVRISTTFDFMAQKGAVYARISQNGQALHVLGTHLQARPDAASHTIRMRQLQEMRDWFDDFKVPKSEPVILAGDFNVSSGDREGLAELLRVTQASVELSSQDIGSISPATNEYLNLISFRPEEKTLDFVLYRTDHLNPSNRPLLKVLNFKSATPWTGPRVFRKDVELRDLSDHYPTLAAFEF